MSLSEEEDMSNRILLTIEKIVLNDLNIMEFTIIPTAEDNLKNKSPVLYEQHSIGLESWCVQHVYQYACSVLFGCREQLSKRKLPYNKMKELNHLLMGVLLINPNVSTFWNMRRELVEMEILNTEGELYFSKIILTNKAKASDVFAYRRWLLERKIDKLKANDMEIPYSLLHNELSVTHMASEKSQNNYHSWNHRIWCIEKMASKRQIQDIILEELNYTQEWISNHISEHTGYHYRQYLTKLVKHHQMKSSIFEQFYNFVLSEFLPSQRIESHSDLLVYLMGEPDRTLSYEDMLSYTNYVCLLLYDLCVLCDKLNLLFPEHESLYCHRRFLVHHLLQLPFEFQSSQGQRCPKIETKNAVISIANNIDANKWPKLFKLSVNKYEGYTLCDIVINCDKMFLAQNENSHQALKYKKWLSNVIGFE